MIYRNVGRLKANELMMLGEPITAAEALELGIANRIVPAEDFEDTVRDWAERLAAKSPLLMRLGKNAISATRDLPQAEALATLQAQLALAFTTEDITEGVAAFQEKRSPAWTMR